MGFKLISTALPCKSAHVGGLLELGLTGEILVLLHFVQKLMQAAKSTGNDARDRKPNSAAAEPVRPQNYPQDEALL